MPTSVEAATAAETPTVEPAKTGAKNTAMAAIAAVAKGVTQTPARTSIRVAEPEPASLYTLTGWSILVKYPLLNFHLADVSMLQTAYLIFSNVMLGINVWQNNYTAFLSYLTWTLISTVFELISDTVLYSLEPPSETNEKPTRTYLLGLSKVVLTLFTWSQLACHTFNRHKRCIYTM